MAKCYTSVPFAIIALASTAAIPVRWSTDAYKIKPLVYECYHGETLDIAAALTAYGEPLNFAGKTAKLYWQTNGMASAWWSTNAFVRVESGSTNILAAIWSGAYDTGAAYVTGFIGVEGENYRAAFQLNFKASPGFVPNQMPIPPKTIDWASVDNVNVESAPFVVKGGAGGVTLQQVTNVANDRIDAKVADWAMKPNQPPQSGTDTNAVVSISSTQITNSVQSGYLCTSNAAVTIAGAAEENAKAASVPIEGNCVKFGNLSLSCGYLELGLIGEGIRPTDMPNIQIAPCRNSNYGDVFLGYKGFKNRGKDGFNPGFATEAEWEIATIGDIPDAYTKTQIDGTTVTNGGAKAYADGTFAKIGDIPSTNGLITATTATNIAEAVASSQFTTNNADLVSVVTNLAPSKARGISLADPVRHCNWYQCVTNGVFFWLVEE